MPAAGSKCRDARLSLRRAGLRRLRSGPFEGPAIVKPPALLEDGYSPALSGQFIFDDSELPFCKATRHAPLPDWISSTGVRPLLMLSYWLNYHSWAQIRLATIS